MTVLLDKVCIFRYSIIELNFEHFLHVMLVKEVKVIVIESLT